MSEQTETPALRPELSDEFVGLIRGIFTRATSAFIIIFGRRETGKTDLSLLIAEILYSLGIVKWVATNIKIYHSPFPIEHITSLEDLRLWCQTHEGLKLFILDEAGKAARRRTPMASLNIKILDDLQILRKYKLSSIWIAPAEKYIDSASLGSDVLDAIFSKPNFKNPKVALYDDLLEDEHKSITDIPPTSIEFDTWDVAPFTERSAKKVPKFKDKDLEMLWKWSHGETCKGLGLFPTQLNRILRKFVKEVLEREHNT